MVGQLRGHHRGFLSPDLALRLSPESPHRSAGGEAVEREVYRRLTSLLISAGSINLPYFAGVDVSVVGSPTFAPDVAELLRRRCASLVLRGLVNHQRGPRMELPVVEIEGSLSGPLFRLFPASYVERKNVDSWELVGLVPRVPTAHGFAVCSRIVVIRRVNFQAIQSIGA